MLHHRHIRVLALAAAVSILTAPLAYAGRTLSAPSPLASAPTASAITLSWTNISGETGFSVERRTVGAATFAEIAKLGTDVTEFKDVVANTGQFEYRVRAYKASGGRLLYSPYTNSAFSAVPCT